MARVAATRWGSSSAVQKVSVSPLRFSLPVLPQAAAVRTAMTTMARRHLPHFIDGHDVAWLRSQPAAAAAGSTFRSSTWLFMSTRSSVVSWEVTASTTRTSPVP